MTRKNLIQQKKHNTEKKNAVNIWFRWERDEQEKEKKKKIVVNDNNKTSWTRRKCE